MANELLSKNKADLVKAAAEEAGVTSKVAASVLNSILETIEETLKDGGSVNLPGFGKFEVSEKAAHTGRNPLTGEEIEVAASKSPKFKASKALKERING